MLGFTILLVAGVALARADRPAPPPPYVQSREAYSDMRTYVSEALTPGAGNFMTHDGRTHLAFGILAGSIAALVTANRSEPDYNQLLLLNKHIPYAWGHYQEIASKAQLLLNDASVKIQTLEELIDHICDADSIEQCNIKVHEKVIRNSAYKLPAELLLLLGKASDSIRNLQAKIDSVTNLRTEIPYLINNAATPEISALVVQLDEAHKKMKHMQYRRLFNLNIGSHFLGIL